jgi:5'-nucleotidase
MKLRSIVATAMLGLTGPAFALNIVLSNDDGLTINLKALY